jgi:putative pyruvate formate lyase activating enzyme
MLTLQAKGCHNINLVTPTHVVPQILVSLDMAIDGGLSIPLVYNSSGYDKVETLKILDGVIDIYMPDFKFWDGNVSAETCDAPDYPEKARQAILEMHRQVGDLQVDEQGIARRGLLIRHLVLPEGLAGTRKIMKFIAQNLSPDSYVNIMSQYRPCGRAAEVSGLNSNLKPDEYHAAVQAAKAEGINRLDRPQRVHAFR